MHGRVGSKSPYTSSEITSVFQEISGNTDLATLLWLGSAAEFAFHKDVDWLFFGKGILRDAIARALISAQYQKLFAFGSPEQQRQVAQRVRSIHTALERKRGYAIPPEAYRDVLLMLIAMGERSYELLHGPMSAEQREQYFEECKKLGDGMGIADLPQTYEEYLCAREESLCHHYHPSAYSERLFQAYRALFGPLRYALVQRLMALLSPPQIAALHHFQAGWLVPLALRLYRRARNKQLIALLEIILIPHRYRQQAHALNAWAVTPLQGKHALHFKLKF